MTRHWLVARWWLLTLFNTRLPLPLPYSSLGFTIGTVHARAPGLPGSSCALESIFCPPANVGVDQLPWHAPIAGEFLCVLVWVGGTAGGCYLTYNDIKGSGMSPV
jgi:hypothetical protein